MTVYDLDCIYDNRKSFYGKAKVIYDGAVEKLISYNTVIGQMTNGKVDFADYGYSMTSNRHLNEWLKQHDLNPADYK